MELSERPKVFMDPADLFLKLIGNNKPSLKMDFDLSADAIASGADETMRRPHFLQRVFIESDRYLDVFTRM